MASRDDIFQFINEQLGITLWKDYGPNGMQVVGTEHVERIATGVSANVQLFEQASADNAQMVLVHHGLFWRNTPQIIDPIMKRRLSLLFDNNISLGAYHLPLDAHESLGNNALIADGLGLTRTDEAFAVYDGKPVGVVGEYESAVSFDDFEKRIAQLTQREPLHLGSRPESIRRVAVCSGGAQSELASAAELGVDAFITGEAGEPTRADALEREIAFFAAGHYATETFGIKRLGELVAEKFNVEHHFYSIPTPV